MYKQRHIRYRTPRYIIVLLLLLFTVSVASAVQVLKFSDAASEAIRIAEDAVALSNKYHNQMEALVESNQIIQAENEALKEALSTYTGDFVASSPTPPHYFDVAITEDLQSYIWSLCCLYGIEDRYELVYAVVQHESNFSASAISATNDYGLMQINVCNHGWLQKTLGIVDFLDPYENVHGGIYILATLLHKYDMPDALMAYNMGEGGAAKLWRRGIHSTGYTDQVLAYYSQFTEDI